MYVVHIFVVAHRQGRLHDLDDFLTRIRVAIQRPEYRRRLLSGLDVPGGITMLRLLRAVELLSAGNGPSIKDVATRLAVEHSTASRSVDAAVQAGLLSKDSCQDDLRRARLELTSDGRALLSETSRRRRELLDEVTGGWPPEDVDRLVQLLDALCEGFDALESSR